jgi:AAA15 family ATPase/GTPase
MITQIDISNFRSIKEQSIPLKKLNILYGANGSGKSSVGYAPYVFRNFYINPNQRLNSLFNLGFINLGGFNEIKTGAVINKPYVEISLKFPLSSSEQHTLFTESNSLELSLMLCDSNSRSGIELQIGEDDFSVVFDFPYDLSENELVILGADYNIAWNGVTFEKYPNSRDNGAVAILNGFFQEIKDIEVISVRRGFFNPIFSTEQATEESLFAMQIRNEGLSFESKIDFYFKKIFNKNFRFVAIPGSTSFYLKTQNLKGHTTDLVNEGFGVNQTVYMLAKLLKQSTSLAFIEEPEIHLHPSAQAKLVNVFTEIIQTEGKQIFLSTHSENIVSTVLAKIAKGELNKEDVQFYLAKYEDGETKIVPQEVNDKGQIEGGLMNFMETELSNLKTLLGV